jgi:HlyD family secretion protein
MMDVARERPRSIPKMLYAVAAIASLAILSAWAFLSFTRQENAVVVDRSTLVTDVAQRGTLLRSVTAQGTFAPERVRVVSATQAGVVNEIFVKPGSVVSAGAPIAQMQNPDLEAAVTSAQSALRVAQANLADAREQARASIISQQSNLADARAQLQSNALQARSYAELHKSGMIASLPYQQAQIQAQKSLNEVSNGRAQVSVATADGQAKVAAAQAQVEQAAAQLAAAQAQVDALTVHAATSGIVQSIDVDPGVSVAQSTEIARLADVHELKAVLQVAESDVHVVGIGMLARIDTGNGVFTGRVSHMAPTAQNGTVAVDVSFSEPVPGARPDANVEGTIVIAEIPNAVSIARPAAASDGAVIDVFKIVDGGAMAVRSRVRLGQGSNDRVQVLSGIAPGETVIVSDMSNYSNHDELRLR